MTFPKRMLKSKEVYELRAQQGWKSYPFSHVLTLLEEYWIQYRYWPLIRAIVPFGKDVNSVSDVGCGVTSVL